MDTGGHSLSHTVFAFERHPAGELPRQSLPLARLLLRLQPLFILRLLLRRPARHPAVPAALAADSPAKAAQRRLPFPLDRGGPPPTEDPRSLVEANLGLAQETKKN